MQEPFERVAADPVAALRRAIHDGQLEAARLGVAGLSCVCMSIRKSYRQDRWAAHAELTHGGAFSDDRLG